jgi:two-component system chemotaxis sensor kinase CheA
LVARLEEIDLDSIEEADGTPVVQHRDQLIPLIAVDKKSQRASEGHQQVIVFTDGDHSMGLMVDKIVDIVEDHLNVELRSDKQDVLVPQMIAPVTG